MCIEVEYITDLQKIMEYGAMSMPEAYLVLMLIPLASARLPSDIHAKTASAIVTAKTSIIIKFFAINRCLFGLAFFAII